MRAIDDYQGTFVTRCALRLAPLVFTRPGELRKAEWMEFDLEKAEWRIPAARMKMREQHIVPLSTQALAILRELQPLTGRFQLERRALPGLALTVNTASMTAIANDYSFEQVYARQVESLGVQGDAAIGITTSGRSRNVVCALEVARKQGLVTIALTGRRGEQLKSMVDFCLCAPSEETPRIQEAHILTGHILCEIIERGLFQ